jgi:hypothetical protein
MGTNNKSSQSEKLHKCFWNLRVASPNAFANESMSAAECFTVGIWKNPVLQAAQLNTDQTKYQCMKSPQPMTS